METRRGVPHHVSHCEGHHAAGQVISLCDNWWNSVGGLTSLLARTGGREDFNGPAAGIYYLVDYKYFIESVQQVTSFLYFAMPPDWRAELQVKFKGDGVTFFAHLLSFFGGKHRKRSMAVCAASMPTTISSSSCPRPAWHRRLALRSTSLRGSRRPAASPTASRSCVECALKVHAHAWGRWRVGAGPGLLLNWKLISCRYSRSSHSGDADPSHREHTSESTTDGMEWKRMSLPAALAAQNVTGEHRTILAVRNGNVELGRVLLDTAARREPFRRMHERRLKPSSEGPGASHQNKCAVGRCVALGRRVETRCFPFGEIASLRLGHSVREGHSWGVGSYTYIQSTSRQVCTVCRR